MLANEHVLNFERESMIGISFVEKTWKHKVSKYVKFELVDYVSICDGFKEIELCGRLKVC